MSFISGLIILDAPASALNNAGADTGAKTDKFVAVKKIKTPDGVYPYVSAQAFRYWLRTTLDTQGNEWIAAPIVRESKIAYTDSNPIKNWDDDLFGYMRAPSKKEGAKNENTTLSKKDTTITRVSPFRVGTFVSISPVGIVSDFGTLSRHEGYPVPFEHEFYRAHLQGLFSLDLTCAGTFFAAEKAGFKNLDSNRINDARENGCQEITVRNQKAWRLPLAERKKRVTALLAGLSKLNGGAKQALHYTDLMPAVIMMAVIKSGNHPFYRSFGSSRKHSTEFSTDAFSELMTVYKDQFLSKIYIGWSKGFLDDERAKLEALIQGEFNDRIEIISHPKTAIESLIEEINSKTEIESEGWFE